METELLFKEMTDVSLHHFMKSTMNWDMAFWKKYIRMLWHMN